MDNNQVCNSKVEVPTGMMLNDKDYLDSLLSTLKQFVKNYAVILTEVSNGTLYNEYKEMFDTYSALQREAYEIMFRKGWYVLEKCDVSKISNKYQTLNQEVMDLNN